MPERFQVVRWAGLWRSENRLDGKREHLLFKDCLPVLARTRQEMREWIELTYGYLRTRPDLKAEPHGWKMPKVIKVIITRAT